MLSDRTEALRIVAPGHILIAAIPNRKTYAQELLQCINTLTNREIILEELQICVVERGDFE